MSTEKPTYAPPRRSPDFWFGREELDTQIDKALEAQKSVLLHGPAGIGKTALAAKAAERWQQRHGEGDVLWFEIGPEAHDEDALLLRIGQTFKNEAAIINAAQPQLKRQAAKDLFGNWRPLIVFDDVWEDAGPSLGEIVRGGGLPDRIPVLITSCFNFSGFGELIKVRVLDRMNALKLLSARAKRPGLQADPVADKICCLLDDLPYALEIAAAWLEVTPDMAPQELLDKVHAQRHELVLPDGTALKGRENIAALLKAQIDDLAKRKPEDEKAFWALGALFAPCVTPELFGLLIRQTPTQAREHLRALAKHSLLHYVPPQTGEHTDYYKLLSLTYSFAASQSKTVERDKIALLKACVDYAEGHTRDNDHAALEAERPNLLGAARFAKEQKQWDDVNRLALALTEKSRFLHQGGYLQEERDLLQLGVQAAQALKRPLDKARHHKNQGVACAEMHQGEEAIEHTERGLAIIRAIENREANSEALDLEQRLLNNLGRIYHYTQNDISKAEAYYEQALAINERRDDREFRATILINLGQVYKERKEYDKAVQTHTEGIEIAREFSDKVAECKHLNNRGMAYEEWDKLEEADRDFQQALRIAEEIRDRVMQSTATGNCGLVKLRQGNLDEAEKRYTAALNIARDIGQHAAEADWLEGLCEVFMQRAKRAADNDDDLAKRELLRQAVEYGEQALKLAEEIGHERANEIWATLERARKERDQATGGESPNKG